MSAFPIAWHKECFENFKASLASKERELARLKDAVSKMHQEAAFYSDQINAATNRGKLAFDKERFLVKKAGTP